MRRRAQRRKLTRNAPDPIGKLNEAVDLLTKASRCVETAQESGLASEYLYSSILDDLWEAQGEMEKIIYEEEEAR